MTDNIIEEIEKDWEKLNKKEKQFCLEAYNEQLKSGTNAKLSENYYEWELAHELGFILKVGKDCFVTGNLFRRLLKIKLGFFL